MYSDTFDSYWRNCIWRSPVVTGINSIKWTVQPQAAGSLSVQWLWAGVNEKPGLLLVSCVDVLEHLDVFAEQCAPLAHRLLHPPQRGIWKVRRFREDRLGLRYPRCMERVGRKECMRAGFATRPVGEEESTLGCQTSQSPTHGWSQPWVSVGEGKKKIQCVHGHMIDRPEAHCC